MLLSRINLAPILLSLVGKGFFSCVSVFFNLVLSKLETSARSGLSDMLAEDLVREMNVFNVNEKAARSFITD